MKKLYTIISLLRIISAIGPIQAIKFYLYKNKKGKSIQLNVRGYKNKFNLRGGTSDAWVFDMNILRQEYKGFVKSPPKTILDGGANIGTASMYWHNLYPEAQIVSVEPDTDNFQILTSNTKSINNISCLQGGIWSSETMLSFKNDEDWKYALKVFEDKQSGHIKAYSIPSIMKKYGWDFIDVLKLDVEGSEVEILSVNMEEWIDKIGMLILELHPDIDLRCTRVLFQAFSNKDFSLRWSGENLIIERLAINSYV